MNIFCLEHYLNDDIVSLLSGVVLYKSYPGVSLNWSSTLLIPRSVFSLEFYLKNIKVSFILKECLNDANLRLLSRVVS